MRKPTIFNSSEKELLISATQINLQVAVNYPDQLARIHALASEVLTMLKSDWDHYYPIECVNYLERVVKDFLEPYAEKMNTLLETPLSKILDQLDTQPIDLKLVAKCNDILGKLGRKRTKFNFIEVFERINGHDLNSKKIAATTTTNESMTFEWTPLAKSNSLSFEFMPGESIGTTDPIIVNPQMTSETSDATEQPAHNNLFIDLITEERSYREVA